MGGVLLLRSQQLTVSTCLRPITIGHIGMVEGLHRYKASPVRKGYRDVVVWDL